VYRVHLIPGAGGNTGTGGFRAGGAGLVREAREARPGGVAAYRPAPPEGGHPDCPIETQVRLMRRCGGEAHEASHMPRVQALVRR